MVEYINNNMGDPDDSDDTLEEWRDFPRLVMKVFTANSYFFTNLMEMSTSTDPEVFKNHNLETVYRIVAQCIYRSSYRKPYQVAEQRLFSFNFNNQPEYVYAAILMPVE
jgi:hypothetical protein